jgi:hypothetical protein
MSVIRRLKFSASAQRHLTPRQFVHFPIDAGTRAEMVRLLSACSAG